MSLNKLIESIITNNQSNNVKFDLTKSFVSNTSHFRDENYDNILPVDVNESESRWEEVIHDNKRYLSKIYKFKNEEHLKYFLNEHIEKSIRTNYYPELFLKGKDIKCFLYTEEINDITNIDIEYSKFLDEIYEDIFFIKE